MFHFLGFLFIIMVFVLVTGLSLIGTLLRSIFGIGRQRTNSDTYQQRSSQSQSSKDIHSRAIGSRTMHHKRPTTKLPFTETARTESVRNSLPRMKESM